jgi:hypothetical protein
MARTANAAIVVVAFVATLLPPVLSGTGEGFVVVVNEANPLDRFGRVDISKLFLKRTAAWPNGVPAALCDLSGTSPVRNAFSLSVHGKPTRAVIAFWQQEIASGRGAPPSVCPSDQMALQLVRENAGGIAYVGAGASLGPGVKALAIAP